MIGVFEKISNLKLQKKLILSYLFVVILPTVFIGYFLVTGTINILFQHSDEVNKISLEQIGKNIVYEINTYINLSDNVITESNLIKYLETEYPESTEIIDKFADYSLVAKQYSTKYLMVNSEQISFSIYSNNPTILYNNRLLREINGEVKKESWYKMAVEKKYKNVLLNTSLNDNNSFHLLMVRVLPPISDDKYDKLLRMEIPESSIYRLIEKEGVNKQIFLIDKDNEVVTCTKPYRQYIGKKITSIHGMSSIGDNNNKSVSIDGIKYNVYIKNINDRNEMGNWRIVCLVSYQSVLGQINEVVKKSIVICIICIMAMMVFVVIFAKKLTKRLNSLVRNMSKIRNGNFQVEVAFEGKDEIGELSYSFRKMIDRINNLISEVYIAQVHVKDMEIKKKQAEMNALQSQINPHFLFNTMESIRMNLIKDGSNEIADVVENFAILLRKSIEWGEDNVTLKKEIELVENYLKIQKFRYIDKFDYKIDIPDDLMNIIIPKFTLQPIVENSIHHGIEMKENAGKLYITATRKLGEIIILIADSGIGMSEQQLLTINNRINNLDNCSKSTRSIGLSNVQHRIKLNFGEQYGISVYSKQNYYTKVEIRLPTYKTSIESRDSTLE